MINTKELLNKIFTDGGFSVQVASGLIPSSGYMVSLQGCEEVYHSEDVTDDTIPGYITRHVKQLLIPGAYLGAWLDGCKVYLDVSINLDNLQAAINLARDNSQLAIYDISLGESIYLDNRKNRQSGGLKRLWPEEYDEELEGKRESNRFHFIDYE